MLTLPPGARVFVATARVDGRKGIDGLSVLVPSQFAEDPLNGTMYVFFSRRADGVRVLYWDRDGYVLVTKRLEKGSFRVPWAADQGRVVIEAAELLLVRPSGPTATDARPSARPIPFTPSPSASSSRPASPRRSRRTSSPSLTGRG